MTYILETPLYFICFWVKQFDSVIFDNYVQTIKSCIRLFAGCFSLCSFFGLLGSSCCFSSRRCYVRLFLFYCGSTFSRCRSCCCCCCCRRLRHIFIQGYSDNAVFV